MGRLAHVAVLVLAGVGCSADDAPPPAITGASSTTQSVGSTTDAGTTAASTTNSTTAVTTAGRQDDACRMCWGDTCMTQGEACFEDPGCACRIDCLGDLPCENACASSTVFLPLLACIVEASIDDCQSTCADPCELCFIDNCRAPFDACVGDELCLCKMWCGNDQACLDGCGTASARHEELGDCYAAIDPVACADVCG